MRSFCCFVLLAVFLIGCSWFKKKPRIDNTVLAQIGEKKLLRQDLITYLPKGLSKQDSIKYAMHFIQKWVTKTLIAQKALENIPNIEQKIQYQVEDYKNDLLAHHYQREFLYQKLDTVVSRESMIKYYQDHPQDFELKQTVIQCTFLKLPKKERDIPNVKKWLASKNPKDRDKLHQIMLSKAQRTTRDSSWHYWDNIAREFPKPDIDPKDIQVNKLYEQQDENYVYLLYVYDKKDANATTPMELVEKTVKELIISQRREKLIQDLEKNLIEEALKSGKLVYGKDVLISNSAKNSSE
ncbi:MAG: hypothetical protein NZ519_09170 [Bacteroidia bacterium]|nr:hypothetical protein [Bacteroidia bacterium]MDW8301703.1 hypothetical protein [Bacteroidia bacterium]